MTDTVGTLVKDTDAFDPVLIELPRVVLSRVRDITATHHSGE